MLPSSWIEIDLGQFHRNIASIRRKIGSRLFCLSIKANAYGHGLIEMGRAAAQAGVDCLGIARLSEGLLLRQAGLSLPLLLFGAVHEAEIETLIEHNIEFSISSLYKAELVAKKCVHKKCRVHLEVDTGMQRTGVRPSSALELARFLEETPCFEWVGIYSHFATSDFPDNSFAKQQIAAFHALKTEIKKKDLIWHLANSGGVVSYPDSYFDMVRPGFLSYGYFPDGRRDPTGEIASCFSLKSKISYFKVVAAESGISYCHRYRTERQTRIVTVPVGYGDGYRRHLTNRGSVLIRGQRYPIAGTVCMDQFMVDIGSGEAYVGEEVILIGKKGSEEISIWDMASWADTSPYEILCALNDRLPRIYRQ